MMDDNSLEQLAKDVKRHLKITWNREETEREIESIMKDAEPKLNHMLGAETDYSVSGINHELFLNYCLYAYNKCSEEFHKAYGRDIQMQRDINEVRYEKENGDPKI